jgi:hypothetical protein
VPADGAGYRQLFEFAQAQVPGRRFWAVEGAGSYGAGLAAFLQARGERVVEVGRPKRPPRRTGAKSDALDAVRAAREALAQDHLLAPVAVATGRRCGLSFAGWPQLNRALHTVVVARLRDDPDTRAYTARRRAEGKSIRDVRRCLKRAVARQFFTLLERHDRRTVEAVKVV